MTLTTILKNLLSAYQPKIQAEIDQEKKEKAGQLDFDNHGKQANQKTQGPDIDLGFKVLKLSDSNFKQLQQFPSLGGVSEGRGGQFPFSGGVSEGRGGKEEHAKALEEQMKLFVDPVAENATIENMVYELLLKSGKDLNSLIEHKFPSSGGVSEGRGGYYCINQNELVIMLEKANQEIVDSVIREQPKKVIALDRLFAGNDQLKTNTMLQMRDAVVEFKTI